jgi:hypothetical protein
VALRIRWCGQRGNPPHHTGSDGTVVISIRGELNAGDERRFANIAVDLPDAIVAFDSPGGNLVAGIEIGKAIRLKDFATAVPASATCASACAIAWLGGRQRMMGANACIGFHAAFLVQDGKAETTGVGNALVGAYLNQLGLPERAVVYITVSPSESVNWLDRDKAEAVGIDVKLLDNKVSKQAAPKVTASKEAVPTVRAVPKPVVASPGRGGAPIESESQTGETAQAQYLLGIAYATGQGVPQTYSEAAKWYRKAAEKGLSGAQYDLGLLYAEGHGVARDYGEAAKWYRKAADQGNAMAQYKLAEVYREGEGVPRDFAEAVKWYQRAAALPLENQTISALA